MEPERRGRGESVKRRGKRWIITEDAEHRRKKAGGMFSETSLFNEHRFGLLQN